MQYDLVFEGGGAKGLALVGACEALFARGHTAGRLLGTSAGAITATLLAAGYSPREMLAALAAPDGGPSVVEGFLEEPPPFTRDEIADSDTRRLLAGVDLAFLPDRVERALDLRLASALAGSRRFRHVVSLVERGGWFEAGRIVEWLTRMLESGTWQEGRRRFGAATLRSFFDATGVELSMVASDTTDARLLVLNHHTAPACPLAWAVRMSMNVPLLWAEVTWRSSWGGYLGRNLEGHAIVDGGLLSNFPIELFVSRDERVTRLMGPRSGNPVLGLLIDERLPVAGASPKRLVRVDVPFARLKIVQRLGRLVDTVTSAHDKMVSEDLSRLVVRLPAEGYGTTEFGMSGARREALVAAGHLAMMRHLDATADEKASSKRAPSPAARRAVDRVALAILG
jgi:predicted acylesterase/phospholipase RssA